MDLSIDKLANVAGALVTVALVTVIVSNRYTANVLRAIGDSFTGALLAAQGKRP